VVLGLVMGWFPWCSWDGPWGEPGMVPGVVFQMVTRVVPGMFVEMVPGVVFMVVSGLVPQTFLGWSPG